MIKSHLQGLQILENLHQKHPKHQAVKQDLIHTYITLGKEDHHKKALELISQISEDKGNIPILKLKAWRAYQQNEKEVENDFWQQILNKSFGGINEDDCFLLPRRAIQVTKKDMVLFSKVYNESLRLPFFFQHYRKLGVTKFVIVDNNSTDNSLDILLEQPDCYVYWTNEAHSRARGGLIWMNHLIKKHLIEGQWGLYVDADEFLVYPNYEQKTLSDLSVYLDKEGYTIMHSFMLDMFPKNLYNQLEVQSGDNLIIKSPYFYNNYHYFYQIESPYVQPIGGIFASFDVHYDILTKNALFKYNKNFRFIMCNHYTTPMKVADVTSAYLHFKMIGDFKQKSFEEIKRKQYAGSGNKYAKFVRMYEKFIDQDFTHLPKTTKYQNSQQLVELGLIKTSDEWEKCVQTESVNQ